VVPLAHFVGTVKTSETCFSSAKTFHCITLTVSGNSTGANQTLINCMNYEVACVKQSG